MGWSGFDKREDPYDVENYIDLIIYEFEEISGIQSIISNHEEEFLKSLPPIKQIKEGVEPGDIQCKNNSFITIQIIGRPFLYEIF